MDAIEAIIWDAAQAPPPFSGQVPWTFHVIVGAEPIARFGARAKQYAADHHPAESAWAQRPDFEAFWNAPVVILISGRAEDCCRAGTNLMLSAHARGLGTCWVGAPMEWLRTPEAKAELKIAGELVPACAICLGYANGEPPPPPHARVMPPVVWV